MRRDLPPVTALKAFESAARNQSFSRAAEELLVTQAAISHQIRKLEQYLGAPLFVRTNRAPELTAAAQSFLPHVTRALDDIDRATRMLFGKRGLRRLRLRAVPFFAGRWVMPRLKEYRRQNPNVELHFDHSYGFPDFRRDNVDIAILWGRGMWPGVTADRLMPAPYTIVAGAQLMKGRRPIRKLSDIDHHELLHISNYEIWEEWVRAAKAPIRDVRRGLVSDDQNTVIQGVINGEGVGLAVKYLVEDYLAASILVRPFDIICDLGYSYYLVYPSAALENQSVRTFRSWILEEARWHIDSGAVDLGSQAGPGSAASSDHG
jgi:LysR family transcriptional regulator, glycine cleavage system transcriptional activator